MGSSTLGNILKHRINLELQFVFESFLQDQTREKKKKTQLQVMSLRYSASALRHIKSLSSSLSYPQPLSETHRAAQRLWQRGLSKSYWISPWPRLLQTEQGRSGSLPDAREQSHPGGREVVVHRGHVPAVLSMPTCLFSHKVLIHAGDGLQGI